MNQRRKAGGSLIERKGLVHELNFEGHLYEDRKGNYENYRFGLLNGDPFDKAEWKTKREKLRKKSRMPN